MKELQNLMSIGDVAKSFGVCVATVRRWCKNGKFSRVIRTIGNQRRFDPDEVHEILHPNLDKRSSGPDISAISELLRPSSTES
jgi:excisionase family DNA binding protein